MMCKLLHELIFNRHLSFSANTVNSEIYIGKLQDLRVMGYHNFPDITKAYLLCIFMYPATPWTDPTWLALLGVTLQAIVWMP